MLRLSCREAGHDPAGDVRSILPAAHPTPAAALSGPARSVGYDGVSKRARTETELHG